MDTFSIVFITVAALVGLVCGSWYARSAEHSDDASPALTGAIAFAAAVCWPFLLFAIAIWLLGWALKRVNQ